MEEMWNCGAIGKWWCVLMECGFGRESTLRVKQESLEWSVSWGYLLGADLGIMMEYLGPLDWAAEQNKQNIFNHTF